MTTTIPPIDGSRYAGAYWELLSKLAEFLRASRAGQYAELIERGHMDANRAIIDEMSRAAIAADWRAIASREQRDGTDDVPHRWKIDTLRLALENSSAHVARLAINGQPIGDHVDLRDAISHLLHCYAQSFVGLKLGEQAHNREIGRTGGAEFMDRAA